MSVEIWSWILFANVILFGISQYYALLGQVNYYTMTPVAVLHVTKIISLIIFGIASQLFAFIGMAIFEIIVIILSTIKVGKVQNDYQ